MRLRQDITELLSGFERRMRFIHIARAMFDYSFKENIHEMIPDRAILDHLTVTRRQSSRATNSSVVSEI